MSPAILIILTLFAFFSAAAAEKQTYVYKTVGDLKIEADVYRPAGKGPFPAVLMLHGGALIVADEWRGAGGPTHALLSAFAWALAATLVK